MKTLISMILAVTLLLSATLLSLSSCGANGSSDQIVCETEDFKVTKPMMAYFFKMQYNSYSSYLEMLGVDPNVSLKEQECPMLKTGIGTWFTYFIELTKGHVTEVLALCQTAHDNGIELEDSDRANIESYISSVEEAAKSNGYSLDKYISAVVGNPLTADDLRACLELEILAEKYSLIYETTFSYTADELEAYYKANSGDLDTVDVYAFTVVAKTGDEANVRAAMETITSATTTAEYKAFVRAYIEETDTTKNETPEARKARIDAEVASCYFKGATRDDFYYSADWAFGAKTGDTYIEESNGTFTAFMLVKEPYRNESSTRTMRHVLFSSETTDSSMADLLYSEWEKSGFTEESISAIAKQYSDDSDSAATGGLLENVIPGNIVADLDEWLFDPARKPGDYGMIESALGLHLVYYVGEGDMNAWETLAHAALANAEYDALISQYIKSIEYHEDVISQIDG